MNITDGNNAINLQKAISILNSEGEKLTPYILTIKNICDNEVDYQVNLETLDIENKLADQYVTLKVNNDENKILNTYSPTEGIVENRLNAYILYKGHLKKNQVMSFEIRMWMGEEVKAIDEVMNKLFQSKVTVEATVNNKNEEYKEDILNGADPVLKDNLIPVTIDDKGNVYKADTKSAWYNYADKKWANAVILEDGIAAPQPGAKIEESEIESYFVWIPKYSYQLWDLGNYNGLTEIDETKPHTIPIRFGTNDTSDEVKGECETPMNTEKNQGLSGGIGECQVGEYMTHPAFISFSVNGLWVGKFETGYNQNENTADNNLKTNWTVDGAKQNTEAPTKVIIKPNVYSWRSITVGKAYHTSYNFQRNLDSHMMKNTEWGAVAYLSHSKYGTCTNGICSEVRINNSSNFVTGVAAINTPNAGYTGYKEYFLTTPNQANAKSNVYPNSSIASTTLNNTGIFDMVGGSWEYVMGYLSGIVGSSELTENNELKEENSKYFDKYTNKTEDEYNKRILGDATGENGPFGIKKYDNYSSRINSWYEDDAVFVSPTISWQKCGCAFLDGSMAGLFAHSRGIGSEDGNVSFRIVLAPQTT